MNKSIKPTGVWRDPLILSGSRQQADSEDIRPTDSDHGALDPKTYDAVETDELFATINHTQTQIGRMILYRSLARPISDTKVLQQKQEAVRELESNPELYRGLQGFVKKMMPGEKSLYHLLYGEFSGGLSTDDEPKEGSKKLEFGGCGYRQYVDGTEFAMDLVEDANLLPQPKTAYLNDLLNAIRDFSQSRTYALMHGPVYSSGGKFKTKQEKPKFLLKPSFHPSMFKLIPMLVFMAAIGVILTFFHSMLPELGASYVGYGILALTVPVIPVILLAIGVSDRDSIIYPLRQQFRQSAELAKALEALGMIDELLSLHHYGQSIEGAKVLPEILDHKNHLLNVTNARNPLLIKSDPDFVPNDITLDATGRLLIITGPNSGGKTAYCKTVAQIQLLGQTGGYIPASTAQLVPVERIYYQVPDPGRLEAGIGRFGHELKRTREIFFNSTPHSLVILDELSEGTTFEERMVTTTPPYKIIKKALDRFLGDKSWVFFVAN
ncbi:MAG: DNA mismatch repair protein MutS, partial [Nitrosomonas sp.]|nr:DNA mismatch repair protein MutS [Nitrosomonas sp.]